jgi:hypothetical protein
VTATRQLPRRVAFALSVTRVLALGVMLVALVSGFAAPTTREPGPSAPPLDLQTRGLQRAMSEHGCTPTGFRGTASPRSALIQRNGALRHVTFQQGWSVFTGERRGRLVAVCLAER